MNKPTLLPPNATELERAIEQASARIEDVPVLVATLWDPDRCDARWLGWLAWALSVDVWDAGWDDKTKREVIKQAVPVHRVKGTIGAVRRALATLGIRIDITEWFEYGPDENAVPHIFRLDAYADNIFEVGYVMDARLLDMVARVIESVKPVRSHLDRLRVGERFDGAIHARAATRAKLHQTGDMDPAPRGNSGTAITHMRSAQRSRRRSHYNHHILRRAA